jgi:hypothetical protein
MQDMTILAISLTSKSQSKTLFEGDIEVRDEVVYYKNNRLHGVVVDKLLEMLRSGMKDSAPLVNFITRLQSNPSANSVNELYSFLSYKSLPNTPEGKVLGVQREFKETIGHKQVMQIQSYYKARLMVDIKFSTKLVQRLKLLADV